MIGLKKTQIIDQHVSPPQKKSLWSPSSVFLHIYIWIQMKLSMCYKILITHNNYLIPKQFLSMYSDLIILYTLDINMYTFVWRHTCH